MAILYIKIIHLIGTFCLFLGFGGLFGIGKDKAIDKLVFGLHGTGLLLVFLSGFAMQGIGKYGFPLWLIAKIVLWIIMVLLFVLIKRQQMKTAAGVIASLITGALVAWLCLIKPF